MRRQLHRHTGRYVTVAAFTLVAAALMLVGASAASAATTITATAVTTPATPTFASVGSAAPPSDASTISGTVTGASVGEKVDLRCYSDPTNSYLVKGSIPVEADGSFTDTEFRPGYRTNCRVRAVPAGTEPTGAELAAFTGPALFTGEANLFEASGSRIPYDFYLDAPQVTAGTAYNSINACGITDGYFHFEEFSKTYTFDCNDFFGGPGGESNSGFLVNGENAYFSKGAWQIGASDPGIPPLEFSYSQNPLDGDMTIHDGESAVFCPTDEFPPSSSNCGEFHPAGVRDERTIEQTHDGQVSIFTDQFSSTDGQAHTVMSEPGNHQYFEVNGSTIEYRFPGQTGYVVPAAVETVDLADSAPGAIYVRVKERPDGDIETGRGAIVFFQPSSPAHLENRNFRNNLTFSNQVTVPATGAATVKYAYVQAYHQSEVEALVAELVPTPAPVTPPTPTPTPVPTPAPVAPPAPGPVKTATPSVKVGLGKLTLAKKKGTAKLEVKVSAAGTLDLSGDGVKAGTVHVKKAGTVTVAILPTAATKKVLRRTGEAKVVVKVALKGAAAGSDSKTRTVHLLMKD
jgi:hypothetical protein